MNRAYYQDPISSFVSKDSRIILVELAQTTDANINVHIRNIFTEGELEPEAVIKDFLITATNGKNYLNHDEQDILNRRLGRSCATIQRPVHGLAFHRKAGPGKQSLQVKLKLSSRRKELSCRL